MKQTRTKRLAVRSTCVLELIGYELYQSNMKLEHVISALSTCFLSCSNEAARFFVLLPNAHFGQMDSVSSKNPLSSSCCNWKWKHACILKIDPTKCPKAAPSNWASFSCTLNGASTTVQNYWDSSQKTVKCASTPISIWQRGHAFSKLFSGFSLVFLLSFFRMPFIKPLLQLDFRSSILIFR